MGRRSLTFISILGAAVGLAAGPVTVGFESDKTGGAPAAWTFARTGQGEPGRWVVEDGKALGTGGRILIQRSEDGTDYRFPVAFAPPAPFTDGSISVRCRSLAGKVDRACGVVLRARSEADYVVARANALEDNVRLYNVTKGSRKQIAGWNGAVSADAWHTLGLAAKGDTYVVTFDGKDVIRARDAVQAGPGRAGLWTKADSVTAFDSVVVDPVR
jgi:hypothetical protein